MAYNHRKAELQWLKWKEEEERQLRSLGVDEDTIQRLHTYDWEQFKKERNFYEWQETAEDMALWQLEESPEAVTDAQDLLDSIENEQLLAALKKTDAQTLEMLVLWLAGYTAKEVCEKMGVSTYTYYGRLKYFKKKLKKFLGCD